MLNFISNKYLKISSPRGKIIGVDVYSRYIRNNILAIFLRFYAILQIP